MRSAINGLFCICLAVCRFSFDCSLVCYGLEPYGSHRKPGSLSINQICHSLEFKWFTSWWTNILTNCLMVYFLLKMFFHFLCLRPANCPVLGNVLPRGRNSKSLNYESIWLFKKSSNFPKMAIWFLSTFDHSIVTSDQSVFFVWLTVCRSVCGCTCAQQS